MVNADVEIGVVANQAGDVEAHLGLSDQLGLNLVAILLVRQQFL